MLDFIRIELNNKCIALNFVLALFWVVFGFLYCFVVFFIFCLFTFCFAFGLFFYLFLFVFFVYLFACLFFVFGNFFGGRGCLFVCCCMFVCFWFFVWVFFCFFHQYVDDGVLLCAFKTKIHLLYTLSSVKRYSSQIKIQIFIKH